MNKHSTDNSRPLCVDLDGTLVATDTMYESLLLAVRTRPLHLIAAPFWLFQGRAFFKQQLARRAIPDPATLPYRDELVLYLRDQKAAGRRLILTTGTDALVAGTIAKHLDLFDAVLASDGRTNCTGSAKVQAICAHLDGESFDYVGNSTIDLPVWKAGNDALVAAPSKHLLRRLETLKKPTRVFEASGGRASDLVKALRFNQWAKNLLLLIPMLVGHRMALTELWPNLLSCLMAFITFGLCASSVYLCNDVLDLESDRRHPTKRRRPIAAGRVAVSAAVAWSFGLAAAGLLLGSVLLGPMYALMLLIYIAISFSYSLYLKRLLVLDVITLAALYTHRIVAGGLAVDVTPSPWLLAFSMFLFLSLAFVKRYGELVVLRDTTTVGAFGRGYRVGDIDVLRAVGPANGFISVLVFCLYIQSETVADLYEQPALLWGICPILLYWITRLWFLADRKVLTDDPLLFALRDKISYGAALLLLVLVVLAKI